jgi:hypothetical protein
MAILVRLVTWRSGPFAAPIDPSPGSRLHCRGEARVRAAAFTREEQPGSNLSSLNDLGKR